MAFQLKNIVFSFFSNYDKRVDVNKDSNNKGTLQRYNEMLAEDFDLEIIPYLENLLDNTLIPTTALQKFIPYIEQMLGVYFVISSDWDIRRKFLGYVIKYYQIKGTKRAYELMFQMLGFDDVIFTETWTDYSFDSPITFDDEHRRFDMFCNPCSDYTLDLIGGGTITPELYESILKVIEFNEPINARLKGLTFNGGSLVVQHITITIDSLGNLVYNNAYDPDLILTLDSLGNLIIGGPMASYYHIDSFGNLIFTI